MSGRLDLTDAELLMITHLTQPAAQARALDRLRVPYARRIDGTLLVGRDAMNRALGASTQNQPAASTGINWSKAA